MVVSQTLQPPLETTRKMPQPPLETTKQAAEDAPAECPELAGGGPSSRVELEPPVSEQLHQWKAEANLRFDNLNDEIQKVSGRVADVERAQHGGVLPQVPQVFKHGDHVRVTKLSRMEGETGIVVEPEWTGMVKITMDADDDKGNTKTYKANELELVDAPPHAEKPLKVMKSALHGRFKSDCAEDPTAMKTAPSVHFKSDDDEDKGYVQPRSGYKVISRNSASSDSNLLTPFEKSMAGYSSCNSLQKKRDNLSHNTLMCQAKIASELSLSIRLLGIALAFITVIFIWETTNMVVERFFTHTEMQLVIFLALAMVAAVCLMLSHSWIKEAESSLVPSFAYTLSTLFLAIGVWGVVSSTMNVLVEVKQQLFCYALGGVVTFFFTVVYALQTRHNVLLDIASCATTMGLNDDSYGETSEQINDEETTMGATWSTKQV